MRKLINYLAVVGAVVFFASCEDGDEYQPAGYGAPSEVRGVVIAMDEFQNPLPADQQPNVSISLTPEGEGSAAEGSAQGGAEYTIANVPGGMYTATYRAAGFRDLRRPGVSHGGGTATRIDTTFLIKESTTVVSEVTARPRVTNSPIYFDKDVTLRANTPFPLVAGDTVFFLNTQVTPSRNEVLVPRNDTVLIYPKDTAFFDPTVINNFTTYLIAKVKIDTLASPATDDMQRGAMLVLSANDNPTAENYSLIRTQLLAKPIGSVRYRDTMAFQIPLSELESAGIITQANRRVYITAYGLSGRFFAYGSTLSDDRLRYIYPTRNQQRANVTFQDF